MDDLVKRLEVEMEAEGYGSTFEVMEEAAARIRELEGEECDGMASHDGAEPWDPDLVNKYKKQQPIVEAARWVVASGGKVGLKALHKALKELDA